jgi:O-antigen/teichoic acid export membrane protein
MAPTRPDLGRGRSALARDLLLSTGGVLIARLMSAVGGVLVARLLGPSLRGDYALVALAGTAAGTTATWGFEYWVSAATARGIDGSEVRAVIRRHVRRAGLTLVLVGTVVAAALEQWHPSLGAGVGAALAGWAIANVVTMLHLAHLGGQRRMLRISVAQVTGATTYAGILLLLLALDLPSVAAVTATAMASTLTMGLVAATRSRRPVPRPRDEHLRAARTLGLPAMLGELAMLAAYRLDLVLVGMLLDPSDLGRYAVAVAVAELLWIVPAGASQVLLPQVAHDGRGTATGPVILLTATIGAAGAVGLSVAGPYAIPLIFGDAFGGATDALPWLAGASVVLGAWRLLLADLAARGHTRLRLTSAIIATVVMLAADLLLVPVWGIGGAGMASLIAYAVAFVITARTWTTVSGRPARDLYDPSTTWALLCSGLRRLGSGRPTPSVGQPTSQAASSLWEELMDQREPPGS